MTDLAGTIAQFIIPSDGTGAPSMELIDWAHGKFFLLGSGGQRSYTIDPTATQNPILSVVGSPNAGQQPNASAVDSVGNIIWQGGSQNYQTVYRLNPATLAVTLSYGPFSAGSIYPTAIQSSRNMACVTCNGVPYVLCKAQTDGHVNVLRTDTMTPAGAAPNIISSFLGAAFSIAGPSGNTAQAFFLDQTNAGAQATVDIHQITIAAGAENYNIALWPTPNPFITNGLVMTLAASAVDPSWPSLTTTSFGYDARSGNLVLDVRTAVATVLRYLVGINPATGAIVWRLAIANNVNYAMDLTQSRIGVSHLGYLSAASGAAPILGVQTASGDASTGDTVTHIGAGTGFSTQSDDVGQLFIVNCVYGSSGSLVTPVSGTPSSFAGLAMLKVWPTFPVGPTDTTTVADLWFAPTNAFVDLSIIANRRLFVSQTGAAQNLGADGALPQQVSPPVFLSSDGTPPTFSLNNGRGGGFPPTTGSLVVGASNPPGASETHTTFGGASAGSGGVVGDYLTGNIYAFNPATYTDNGTRRRWLRRWRALPQNTFAAIKFTSLSIDMQTGAGVPTTGNPQLMLRWSDDGGHTWSGQRIVAAGTLGQTAQTIKFNRLGMTRRWAGSDRIFELSCADPFMIAILDAEVDG